MSRLLAVAILLIAFCAPAVAATVAPELDPAGGRAAAGLGLLHRQGRGAGRPAAYAAAAARLSERALARRARVGPVGPGATWADLPNDPAYLAWLRDHGFAIRAESRWLAAVSVTAGSPDLARLAAAPFVARPSRCGRRRRRPDDRRAGGTARARQDDPLNYGGSLPELAQVNVPAVHELGYHGEGVVIGMLDSGFDTTHEALAGVDVLGVWDFVNDDPVVADEPGDPPGQDNHGTMTLSTIGGYKPGSLVGPAFAASFYLAKTEDIGQEVPAEEDFWVEGIEWLEAQGCDLVTSSLVYADWYTFADYDGNTCVTTIAADVAVALGLAVFNSAGNYRGVHGHHRRAGRRRQRDHGRRRRDRRRHRRLQLARPHRRRPHQARRLRPRRRQLRGGARHPRPVRDRLGHQLLLSAHRRRRRPAARRASRHQPLAAARGPARDRQPGHGPNNDFGWGIIDALAALQFLETTAVDPPAVVENSPLRLEGCWPNPFNPTTRFVFSLKRPLTVELVVLDLQGRLVRRLDAGSLPAGVHVAVWDGKDDAGQTLPSGVYVARLSGGGSSFQVKVLSLK